MEVGIYHSTDQKYLDNIEKYWLNIQMNYFNFWASMLRAELQMGKLVLMN